jgi:hypothetical protein
MLGVNVKVEFLATVHIVPVSIKVQHWPRQENDRVNLHPSNGTNYYSMCYPVFAQKPNT